MKVYLNWKTSQGRETIDELNQKDFTDYKAFRKEKSRLLSEYTMAYNSNSIYWSSRCCANWKNNS
jgi:hypothetical protein